MAYEKKEPKERVDTPEPPHRKDPIPDTTRIEEEKEEKHKEKDQPDQEDS